MTRKEAIGILNEDLEWAKQNKYPYISKQKQEALTMAIEALVAIDALKEQSIDTAKRLLKQTEKEEAFNRQKWIPVNERLPDKEGQYLVAIQGFKEKFIEVANFSLDLSNVSCLFRREKGRLGWWGRDDGGWNVFIYSGVIAWMPLPEPYEKEGGK